MKPADKELLIKSTIHTGQRTSDIASVLSSGVAGLKIFLTNIQSHLKVSNA
jgi:hypothetical protein